jgi:hypothetical protein
MKGFGSDSCLTVLYSRRTKRVRFKTMVPRAEFQVVPSEPLSNRRRTCDDRDCETNVYRRINWQRVFRFANAALRGECKMLSLTYTDNILQAPRLSTGSRPRSGRQRLSAAQLKLLTR